jgi:hypothetical protein
MAYDYLRQQSTFSGDAVLTSNYYDNTVIAGKSYIIETVFPIGTSATVYIEVNPTALVNKRFTVLPTQWGCTASYLQVTLGVCSSASSGTTVSFLNRNYYFASTNPAATTLRLNAIPTGAVDSPVTFVIGTEVHGVSVGGGTRETGGIQILDPTLDYYFKVVNQTTTPAMISLNVKICETSKDATNGF